MARNVVFAHFAMRNSHNMCMRICLVLRKRGADRDYIEYFECEQEMNEALYDQYQKAERIIGMLS